MKTYVIAIVLLIACSPIASAQESQEYVRCTSKAVTQPQLNDCALQEAERVDAELNQVYRKVLASVSADALATSKVKAAEKAWIAYRDAYLEAMYLAEDKRGEYGSIYPIDANLLVAKLTRRHIEELKDLMEGN